jgi:hypothetical protein
MMALHRQAQLTFPEAVIRRLEMLLRRCYGVHEYTGDADCIFRIAFRNTRNDVMHRDGTLVRSGDAIVELHLWNDHLPRILQTGARHCLGRFHRPTRSPLIPVACGLPRCLSGHCRCIAKPHLVAKWGTGKELLRPALRLRDRRRQGDAAQPRASLLRRFPDLGADTNLQSTRLEGKAISPVSPRHLDVAGRIQQAVEGA